MGMVSLLTGIEIYILRKKDYINVFIIAVMWFGVGIFELYKKHI
jgi:hypothetical protein